MTALAVNRDTVQIDTTVIPESAGLPVASNTIIYAGSIVCTDTAGRAVPASATATLVIAGVAQAQAPNRTTDPSGGAAGAINVTVKRGAFSFGMGSGVNAITIANRGQACYASDDQTLNLTDGGGLWPFAGTIIDVIGTAVIAIIGVSLTGASAGAGGAVAGAGPTHYVRYKAPGNISNLAAFTVLQDGVTGVITNRVLLANQTTGAENGIYTLGTVAAGAAPLTRALDFNAATTAEIEEGVLVAVGEGTVGKDTQWRLTTNAPITLDTTALVFAFQSTAASGSAATAGNKSVRYVMTTNVADLTAFTVAQDGVTGVAGDYVLLANQTTPSQAGVYVIGTVAAGTAPLTRAAWLFTAAVVTGGFSVAVNEGTLNAQSVWFIKEAGQITIGTTSHTWYPESITQSLALVAGTTTVANVPVLSATKTGWSLTRRVANTSTLTVGGYCTTVAGANGVTAGVVGTASVVIEACVGAGTINNADISTLEVTVINR